MFYVDIWGTVGAVDIKTKCRLDSRNKPLQVSMDSLGTFP